MRRSLLLGLGLLLGCAPIAGPVDVEVVQGGGPGEFELTTATLNTVTDLVRGRGEQFDVNANLSVNALTLADVVSESEDYDELVLASRQTAGGDMSARLVRDGERYVGADFDSLHYLTTFHIFEDVFDFAGENLRDDHPALEKGLVGFYGQLNLIDILPIPLQSTDNAAYVPFADAWLTFRVFLADEGIPFAMNPGVVAHEFHHRVFFKTVLAGDAFPLWRGWIIDDPTTRSGNLLRGLDEGLSDLFAVAFTGDPAFMSPSLEGPLAGEAEFRDLEGNFATEVTYDTLETTDLTREHRVHCGPASEDLFAEERFNFYCVGTVVATALWASADRDPEVLRAEVLPAVEGALDQLGAEIVLASEESGELTFDFELFLRPLAERLPEARRARLCEELDVRFETLVPQVPACSG
jgi:hypothetical protein